MHSSPFSRTRLAAIAAAIAIVTMAAAESQGAVLLAEPFQYPVGANLAGQNGGEGFSGAWSSGSSTLVAGLNGGGSAVAINSSGGAQSRQLSSTQSTSGATSYISYLMNSSDFTSGNYTGIDLFQGSTSQLFLGIPFNAQKFGFDAKNSLPIQTINFTPTVNTSYLVAIGLSPSTTSGKVDIKMWATSNLAIDPATLVASTPNAQLLGQKNNFSFDKVVLDGNMPNSLAEQPEGVGACRGADHLGGGRRLRGRRPRALHLVPRAGRPRLHRPLESAPPTNHFSFFFP
jgi:hypothetical protein